MSAGYEKEYEESIHDPERFWARAAREIEWHKPFEKVLDESRGLHKLARKIL
jgi:propionyl-CoA synthetase